LRTASLYFIFLVLVLPVVHQAQDEYRTGISGFYVPEKNNLDIGFTSLDLHCRLINRPGFSADYGLRFIGATTGRRGGYFAFGYFSEFILQPQKKLQPGINLALLAGGGAAAPDRDGWMTQSTLFAQYKFNSGLALRAGINYAFVSGAAIKGFSPLIGLNWKVRTYTKSDTSANTLLAWTAAYGEAGVTRSDETQLNFIGVGSRLNCGKFFSGEILIHALTNKNGGYMQALLSAGPDLPIGSFHIAPGLVAGIGGGGGVRTKGGGLYGGQLAVYYRDKLFYAGIKYQIVQAVSDQFDYKGIFVSVGKTFPHSDTLRIRWAPVIKAYAGNNGFGNLGARFTAFQYQNLRLMGSTFWAFTHGKGAYAEGLFEASLHAPGKIPVYAIASVGAGAGSGINQRKNSVIYALGLGYSLPWKQLPFSIETQYWQGGNIPQWSVALSMHLWQ
jgi:hypothetical protein